MHQVTAHAADIDQPQRRPHHTALANRGGAQLQAAERRIGNGGVGSAGTANGQRTQRVEQDIVANFPPKAQVTRDHPRADLGAGVQLRRAQGHVALGQQLGADTRGDSVLIGPCEKPQVAIAGQVDLVKPTPFDIQQAAIRLAQATLDAKQHTVAHIDEVAAGVELCLGLQLGRRGEPNHRTHIRIQAWRINATQQ